jgi:hypothetical protein
VAERLQPPRKFYAGLVECHSKRRRPGRITVRSLPFRRHWSSRLRLAWRRDHGVSASDRAFTNSRSLTIQRL